MRIANYPLKQYRHLDKLLYPLLCKIANSQHGFPRALLHLPPRLLGIGIPRLSDQIQYSKLGILLRSLHAPPDSPHHIAITSMLARQASLQQTTLGTNQKVILTTSNPSPNWLLSLLQWLDCYNLQIVRQGTPIPNLFSNVSLSQQSLLQEWNVQYPQDILPSDTLSNLSLPPSLSALHDLMEHSLPDTSITILRQHQLWKLPKSYVPPEPSPINTYAEILGWEAHLRLIHVRLWKEISPDKKCPPGNSVLLPLHSTHISSALPYHRIFPNGASHQRYLYQRSPNKQYLDRLLILQHPILRSDPQFSAIYTPTWLSLLARHNNATTIYVSHTTHHTSLSSTLLIPPLLTSQPTSTNTGYIYIVSNSENGSTNSTIISINNLLDYVQLSQVDLFLTTICLHLSANHPLHPIITPTHQSSIKILTESAHRINHRCRNFQLVQSAMQQIALGARLEMQTTTEDILNHQHTFHYIVKLIRQNKLNQPSPIHQVTLSRSVIISNFFTPNTWTICHKDGLPLLTSVSTHVENQRYKQYLHERSKLSNTSHDWEDSTPLLTYNVFKSFTVKLSSRISLTRVLYDKNCHGRNMKKFYHNLSDKCNNCPLSDSIYHWICECSHTTSAFFRSAAVATVTDWYKSKNKLFSGKKEEIVIPTIEKQQKKQLILTNIPITVVKYFLNNLRNPTIAVRLWTANWSVPMIEELYANIRNVKQQP